MFSYTNLQITFYFTDEDGNTSGLVSQTQHYDNFPNKGGGLQLYYLSSNTKYKLTKIFVKSFNYANGYSGSTVTYQWRLKIGSAPSSMSDNSGIGIGGFSFTPNSQFGNYQVPDQTIWINNSPDIYRTTDIYIY